MLVKFRRRFIHSWCSKHAWVIQKKLKSIMVMKEHTTQCNYAFLIISCNGAPWKKKYKALDSLITLVDQFIVLSGLFVGFVCSEKHKNDHQPYPLRTNTTEVCLLYVGGQINGFFWELSVWSLRVLSSLKRLNIRSPENCFLQTLQRCHLPEGDDYLPASV